MMYALVEMGMQLFRRKNYQDFSDIDALAVSMSEKFFAQLGTLISTKSLRRFRSFLLGKALTASARKLRDVTPVDVRTNPAVSR